MRLGGASVRNVLEGQQRGRVACLRVEYLARVQEHDAPPNARKFAIYFVALDGRMIFGDRFENCAQLRDIPLTAFNLINQMSPDIPVDELEDLIESPACSNDAQLLIEHQKRVADGI